ncbi:MAG TPA: hypothetical protein VGM32_24675 [Rhodopila sp.]
MTFILAGCALLLALFVAIAIGDNRGRTRPDVRHDAPPFDGWGR